MKPDVMPSPDLDEIRSVLGNSGLIGRDMEIELKAYAPAFPRIPSYRRWHYQVNCGDQTICHLMTGMHLNLIYERLKEFAQACPALACQPLYFWQKANGLSFICLEYFPGVSCDTLVEKGECTADRWLELNRRAQSLLDQTRLPSTENQLEQELARLMELIGAFPGISPIDLNLLRELALPALLQTMRTEPLTTRWSNGDYCGRNLLVDTQGNLRLIDYEFLGRTHFGNTDWLRLRNFSIVPPQLNWDAIPEIKTAGNPQREIWFWLQHLVQLSTAEFTETVQQHAAKTVGQLFAAIVRESDSRSPEGNHSIFIKLLSTEQSRTQCLLDERTVWAQSLDTELRKALAIIPQQQQVAEERLKWIQSVEAEQMSLRANFDRLTKEHTARTSWAQALEKELQQTKIEHATQANLAQERGSWALSLEKELLLARDAFAKLSLEFNERSTWAKSLDAELQNARTELSELKTACVALAEQLPDDTAKGDIAILKRCQLTLFASRKKIADLESNIGKFLDARLQAEVAETEANRLKTELSFAQVHVDHLLCQVRNLQQSMNALGADKQAAATILQQLEQKLNALLIEKSTILEALSRYERSWICQLANRFPISNISAKPKP